MRILRTRRFPIIRLLVVLSLVIALTLGASSECASANPGPLANSGAMLGDWLAPDGQAELSGTSIPVAANACADAGEWGPEGLAPTVTEKPFWLVLGLVVLGWLVLAADFPEE